MTKRRGRSFQRMARQRQQDEFVGRKQEQARFRDNLQTDPEDEERRFVYALSGQGGVGKTALLQRFRKVAEECGAITAWIDDAQADLPQALGRITDQFAEQGFPIKDLAERCQDYRAACRQLSSDPSAPRGAAFLGRTVARGVMTAASLTPGGAVATAFLDGDEVANQAGEWAQWVARKLAKKEDVQLVLEPEAVLTPLFIDGLWTAAEADHPIALFLDTYERTGAFLDRWLRDLLDGRHGELPLDIAFCLAGRDPLDPNAWSGWEPLIERVELAPFCEDETREYLSRHNVTHPEVVAAIGSMSGGLPLLVATMAVDAPSDPSQLGDPSDTAVERCLKWVAEPAMRRAALDCALPRVLNRDVLAVIVGEAEADRMSDWLRDRPFVTERGGKRVYHPLVRGPMLRYMRRESLRRWSELHGKLAGYYDSIRDAMGLDPASPGTWQDDAWFDCTLETAYHRLCQDPRKNLHAILWAYPIADGATRDHRMRYGGTVLQAGEDADSSEVRNWGQRMLAPWETRGPRMWEAWVGFCDNILGVPAIPTAMQARCHALRSFMYALLWQPEKAMADLTRANELAGWTHFGAQARSTASHYMGWYEEAIDAIRQAIEAKTDMAASLAARARFLSEMGLARQALADLERAMELGLEANPRLGRIPYYLGRYNEALGRFGEELVGDSLSYVWLHCRGDTFRRLGRYLDALQDLDRAVELAPRFHPHRFRALLHVQMGNRDLAEADLRASLAIATAARADSPRDWRSASETALAHVGLGETEQALSVCREMLDARASPYMLRLTVLALDDLLEVMPERTGALELRAEIMAHLDEIGFDLCNPPVPEGMGVGSKE